VPFPSASTTHQTPHTAPTPPHPTQVVHRDLKGGNVLVTRGGVIKLTDFGASRAKSDATAKDDMRSLRGSVYWMAPEVIRGTGCAAGAVGAVGLGLVVVVLVVLWAVDRPWAGGGPDRCGGAKPSRRLPLPLTAPPAPHHPGSRPRPPPRSYGRKADIWSLGCTVIEMLTGRPPWCNLDNHWSALYQIANSEEGPERPQGVSPACRDFLDKCLATDPAARPTAAELLEHPFVAAAEAAVEQLEQEQE
jgi:serine/threonine protein kinase